MKKFSFIKLIKKNDSNISFDPSSTNLEVVFNEFINTKDILKTHI